MSMCADIAVHDRNHRLQLLVEVKSRQGASPQWAARMRRNLLAHGMIPQVDYFMLALPDSFYLWTSSNADDEMPAYVIDAKEALASYVGREGVSLGDISHYGLELLVASWLQDLIGSELSAETVVSGLRGLFDSGLYAAIKNSSVETESVV